jgi:hypothetical protein
MGGSRQIRAEVQVDCPLWSEIQINCGDNPLLRA